MKQDTEEKSYNKLKFVDSEIKINAFFVIIPLLYLLLFSYKINGWVILGIDTIIAIVILSFGIIRGLILQSKKREQLIDCGLTENDYNKLNPPIIDLQSKLWQKTTWGKILIVFGVLVLIFIAVMIIIALFEYNYI